MFVYLCLHNYVVLFGTRGTVIEGAMGRLQLVGSIKLLVSFAEYRLFYRSLLRKRHIILSMLLTKATPYVSRAKKHHIVMYIISLGVLE